MAPPTQTNPSIFYNDKYGISISDILKYVLEGLAVATAAFFISPKNRKDYKSILMIGFSAALVFFVIDKFAPKVSAGTRQGSGFGIGFGLVGGSGDNKNLKNNVIEETYVAETPTSISLNDRVEKYFDYGNSKGNQPLTGTGKPGVVVGSSDFDDTLSTVSSEGFANEQMPGEIAKSTKAEGFDGAEAFDNAEGFDGAKAFDSKNEAKEPFANNELEGFESSGKQTSWYPIGSIYDVSAHNTAKYS